MSFINHPRDLTPAPVADPQHHSIWRCMLDALADNRRADAEKAVSDLVARGGGRLTDDIERQIAFYL